MQAPSTGLPTPSAGFPNPLGMHRPMGAAGQLRIPPGNPQGLGGPPGMPRQPPRPNLTPAQIQSIMAAGDARSVISDWPER